MRWIILLNLGAGLLNVVLFAANLTWWNAVCAFISFGVAAWLMSLQ